MKGWSCKFEDPISLPNGKVLITLKDAADQIMKLIARIAEGLGVPALNCWKPSWRTSPPPRGHPLLQTPLIWRLFF